MAASPGPGGLGSGGSPFPVYEKPTFSQYDPNMISATPTMPWLGTSFAPIPATPATTPAPSTSQGTSTSSSSTPAAPTFTYATAPIGDILAGDPFYQQLSQALQAGKTEDQAFMSGNIARMNAYYGNESNPVSIYGRLKSALDIQSQKIVNNLAARGIILSGGLGVEQNHNRLAYEQARADAAFKLADYIAGVQQAFAQAHRGDALQLLDAQFKAVNDWLASHQPTSSGIVTPGDQNPPDSNPPPDAAPSIAQPGDQGIPFLQKIFAQAGQPPHYDPNAKSPGVIF